MGMEAKNEVLFLCECVEEVETLMRAYMFFTSIPEKIEV